MLLGDSNSIYIGDTPIDAVYIGSDLVWPISKSPEYADTDKTTVILLDSNGNRTNHIEQFSAVSPNPLIYVKSYLNRWKPNYYDVVIGKDFLKEFTGGISGIISDGGLSTCTGITNLEIYCTSTGIGTSYVNSLGPRFCNGCTSLKKIILPTSLRNIDEACFAGCTSLNEIFKIPANVETIGYNSFSVCSSLTRIEIPASVTTIDKTAFFGCSSLREIVIDKPQDSIADAPWTWNKKVGFSPADVTVTWKS